MFRELGNLFAKFYEKKKEKLVDCTNKFHRFAAKFYSTTIGETNQSQNFVTSPFALSMVLLMLYFGKIYF